MKTRIATTLLTLCLLIVSLFPGRALAADESGTLTRLTELPEGTQFFEGMVWRGTYYFSVSIPTEDGSDTNLWVSDGTPAGTHPFFDSASGQRVAPWTHGGVVEMSGVLYFYGNDGVHGIELWRTDGTPDGTWMVKDTDDGERIKYGDLTLLNGMLYYVAHEFPYGFLIYRSDGTPEGTQPFFYLGSDCDPDDASYACYGMEFTHLGTVNGLLVFNVQSDYSTYRLFATDGKSQPVVIYSGIYPESIYHTQFNSRLFFHENGFLFSTDGSRVGTRRVYGKGGELNDLVYDPTELKVVGSTLYIGSGGKLWKLHSGSVEAETVRTFMDDIVYYLRELNTVNNTLVFRTYRSMNSGTYWKSDGTANGTSILCPQCGYTLPELDHSTAPETMGAILYFPAFTTGNGMELWQTDGTSAGTRLFIDMYPGSASSSPRNLAAYGPKLFFTADDGINDAQLYVYTLKQDESVYVPFVQK